MLKKLIKKILYKHKATSETYVEYLKRKGVSCGDNIKIFFPHDTTIDVLNPHLLTIGSNVAMTGPATILTHDYSVVVANQISKGRLYGKQQAVVIGNNVFIGWGGVILPGTTIGNNVIVGAGAVISGKVESNSVYAGNPAKRIYSIDEYIVKREKKQLSEAVDIYIRYFERFKTKPSELIFHEYFYLFSQGKNLKKEFISKIQENNNIDEYLDYLKLYKPLFKNYDSFCEYAMKEFYKTMGGNDAKSNAGLRHSS